MADEIDIELRSATDVARRAVAVATVLQRVALEEVAGRNDIDVAGEAFDLREWILTERLSEALTANEVRLVETPLGSISRAERLDLSWQTEALAALLWSIGVQKSPEPGLPSELTALLDDLPHPWDRVSGWVDRARLRPETEIARARELADIWHWRFGAEIERRRSPGSDRPAYEQVIQEVVMEAAGAGYAVDAKRSDFIVSGQLVREIESAELNKLAALAEERLLALNWVCGFGESWNDVPLEV